MQQLALDSNATEMQSPWRPNHVIQAVSGRRYTFGAELNTRPREAEIRKAIEWAESGTPEAHGEFVGHVLPMMLAMDPDLPPPTRIGQASVLNLDLGALFRAGREAEFHKVFEGAEQAKPQDRGQLISLRMQELALRQYAPPATPAAEVVEAVPVPELESAPRRNPPQREDAVPIEAPVEAVGIMAPKVRKPRNRKQEQTPVYLTHPHLPLSERFLLYKLPLSPDHVAAEVDVVRNTVYRWIRAGTLPVRPAGRFLKCDQGPLAEWAKKREFLPPDQR